jgi:Cys/Met metabolism PLP-dependent enzyme
MGITYWCMQSIRDEVIYSNLTLCIVLQSVDYSFVFLFQGFEYSRSGNPTRNCTEKCIAALENGKHCKFDMLTDFISVFSCQS